MWVPGQQDMSRLQVPGTDDLQIWRVALNGACCVNKHSRIADKVFHLVGRAGGHGYIGTIQVVE